MVLLFVVRGRGTTTDGRGQVEEIIQLIAALVFVYSRGHRTAQSSLSRVRLTAAQLVCASHSIVDP